MKERRRDQDEGDVTTRLCNLKKHGRPVLVGKYLDAKIHVFSPFSWQLVLTTYKLCCGIVIGTNIFENTHGWSGVVKGRIAISMAHGTVLACDKSKQADFGGQVKLTHQRLICSLPKKTHFVQGNATTAKRRHTPENFLELKKSFLEDVVNVIMEEIPTALILNWDQTRV